MFLFDVAAALDPSWSFGRALRHLVMETTWTELIVCPSCPKSDSVYSITESSQLLDGDSKFQDVSNHCSRGLSANVHITSAKSKWVLQSFTKTFGQGIVEFASFCRTRTRRVPRISHRDMSGSQRFRSSSFTKIFPLIFTST